MATGRKQKHLPPVLPPVPVRRFMVSGVPSTDFKSASYLNGAVARYESLEGWIVPESKSQAHRNCDVATRLSEQVVQKVITSENLQGWFAIDRSRTREASQNQTYSIFRAGEGGTGTSIEDIHDLKETWTSCLKLSDASFELRPRTRSCECMRPAPIRRFTGSN